MCVGHVSDGTAPRQHMPSLKCIKCGTGGIVSLMGHGVALWYCVTNCTQCGTGVIVSLTWHWRYCVTNGTQCDTGGIVSLMVHGVLLDVLCH